MKSVHRKGVEQHAKIKGVDDMMTVAEFFKIALVALVAGSVGYGISKVGIKNLFN